MYKISTTKIYYGISDLSSEGYYGLRVNFSPNAQFFVALTILDTSNLNKIQVFETSTGNLISSRTYLTAKKHSDLFTFTLLLNSAGTAGYHLFTKYLVGSTCSTCLGQYLFRFEPISQL